MIVTDKSLAELALRLKDAPWVAMDTEADSRHCYFEKLCLLQVTDPAGDELVDTLAKLDMTPLFDALQGKELILHGADFDLRILRRTTGFTPYAIVDTDIAARLLGKTQTSLSALVLEFFGVQMEKTSQKADWAIRPLPEKMLKYATCDTHYLKLLCDILCGQLDKLGRLDWLRQMCADLIKRSAITRTRDPEMLWRVKGWSDLSRPALAILRELWHWRESEAQAVDRPPFHILMNERLVAIAEVASEGKSFDHIIPQRMRPERRIRLLEAIKRGQETDGNTISRLPRRERVRPTAEMVTRLNEMKTIRDARATELGIDPTLIASRATLEALAQDLESNKSLLLPWQKKMLEIA